MNIIKKLLLITCVYFGNSYSNEMLKFVENLKFRELKDIIDSKKYSKEELRACNLAIENIVMQKSKTTPWYKNFKFLSRLGLGTASTIYFSNMLVKGIKDTFLNERRRHREPTVIDFIAGVLKLYTVIGITQLMFVPILHSFLPEDIIISSLGIPGGLITFRKGIGSLGLIQDKDYPKALAIKTLLRSNS